MAINLADDLSIYLAKMGSMRTGLIVPEGEVWSLLHQCIDDDL